MGGGLQIEAHTSFDQVKKCRDDCGRDENVGPKTLAATPFYMAWSI
jgi:hypothetical protein